MRRNGKKILRLLLLAALCLLLSGCRTRTTGGGRGEKETEAADAAGAGSHGALRDSGAEETGEADAGEEAGGRTKENPEAPRKEYDENAAAEIAPGAERTVHGAGEGNGASATGEDAEETTDKLNAAAEKTARQTVAAAGAERKGVAEDAEEADSAMTYYSALLRSRTASLFECQRLSVYWETAEDHVTVYKTSPEHQMITDAGAYDVSARLLPENLRVDDGWIGRKNPGVIVKIVNGGALGPGVSSLRSAERIRAALLAREGWKAIDAVQNGRVLLLSGELLTAPHLRLAGMLVIAKTANPALFSDLDAEKALEMLSEEAAGGTPSGIYWYDGPGGV